MRDASLPYMTISEACSVCFKNNIKIYRVPINTTQFIIELNYDGRIKRGTETYSATKDQQKMSDVIRRMYVTIASSILSKG